MRACSMTVDDVLITSELLLRRERPANYHAENRLLHLVGAHLAAPPQKLLSSLVINARSLCRAGSAGLSLLESGSNGVQLFRWAALAGKYRKFVGGTTPGNFSPCGTCLEREAPQLYRNPHRFFKYLSKASPRIVEGLVIPIAVDGNKLGTVWIVSHDNARRFDAEDARIMASIAAFLGIVIQQSKLRVETEKLLSGARRSEEFSLKLLSSSPDCIKLLNHAGRVEYMNEPGLRALKVKPKDVIGKSWVSFWQRKHQPAVRNAILSAKRGRESRFEAPRPTAKGEPRWWDIIVTPLEGDKLSPPKFLCISRDITARVVATQQLAEAHQLLEIRAATLETRVSERTAALQQANAHMQHLAMKLVCSQDDERRSIARELHDEVGQQLTGLKLLLEQPKGSSPEACQAIFDQACLATSSLQKQVQTLSFALRQSIPDHVTLKRALQWHFHLLEQSGKLAIHFKCGRLDEKGLGHEVRHTLFRIVQEALTNVIRHSKAGNAHVTLTKAASAVSVRITDNGSGFVVPRKADRQSAGLSGMEERVQLLGGSFSLSSRKGQGTCVFATLPCGRKEPATARP